MSAHPKFRRQNCTGRLGVQQYSRKREHRPPSGTFRDIPKRKEFFDEIATMKPGGWRPGSVDAIATRSADGRRIVIKAVNYEGQRSTLLVRLQGEGALEKASLDRPDAIAPVSRTLDYANEFTVDLEPYTVAVVECRAA